MASLKKLLCRAARFTVIPPQFGLLTSLEELELEIPAIKVPPKEIARNGQDAIVSYCKIVHDSVESHVLNLQDFAFDELPVDVCTVPGLTELYVDRNQISLIPPHPFRTGTGQDAKEEPTDIFDVTSGVVFKGIPDLFDITSLTKISATRNNLVTLPETVSKLTNLLELHLNDNQLTSLPEELGDVQTLTLLTILNNELTVLPVTIGNLSELEVFEADFESKVIAPPHEVTRLRAAKGLSYVLEYMLAFCDARREHEIELIELELVSMPTELLDDDVGAVTSTIKSISLASNKLSKLPTDMYSLAVLSALDLSENNIHELPEGFVEMRALEALVSLPFPLLIPPAHHFSLQVVTRICIL